jgi:hypothetical protein
MVKILPLIIGVGVALIIYNMSKEDKTDKRLKLISEGFPADIVNLMTDAEISDTYSWVYEYIKPGIRDSVPADLVARISIISSKYNIMT